MHTYISLLLSPVSPHIVFYALCGMRIGIGILSIGHGFPKIVGGPAQWRELGQAITVFGIHFLPVFWGFLAACAEFFGGIALTVGFGTRIASISLIGTMIVACAWHLQRGDPYSAYSFSLSLLVVFFTLFIVGSGPLSVDQYLTR